MPNPDFRYQQEAAALVEALGLRGSDVGDRITRFETLLAQRDQQLEDFLGTIVRRVEAAEALGNGSSHAGGATWADLPFASNVVVTYTKARIHSKFVVTGSLHGRVTAVSGGGALVALGCRILDSTGTEVVTSTRIASTPVIDAVPFSCAASVEIAADLEPGVYTVEARTRTDDAATVWQSSAVGSASLMVAESL